MIAVRLVLTVAFTVAFTGAVLTMAAPSVTDLSRRTPGRPDLTEEYPPRPRHPE